MGIEKARKYLKSNELVAVPFDKGIGFCVMKEPTYEAKLTQLLGPKQSQRSDNMKGSICEKKMKKK